MGALSAALGGGPESTRETPAMNTDIELPSHADVHYWTS